MRLPLLSGFVFHAQTRAIDFSAVPGFDPRNLLSVINLTARQEIYALGEAGFGYSAFANGVLTLDYDTRPMDDSDVLFVMVEDGITHLAPDAATASRQDQAKAVLQSILGAIQAQRVETIWTDDTGTRFIRLDSAGTITWTDVAGNPSTAPGTGARPDSDSGTVVSRSTYRATASGTGFASGDILDHLVVTDGDAGDLVSNFWINVTAGTKIAAPPVGSITPLATLPDGAATAARQDSEIAALTSLVAGLGAPTDGAPAGDAASGSLIGKITRLLVTQSGIATVLAAIRDRLPSALVGGRLPVDGSGVTQPVSAAALPLPNGAAQDGSDPASPAVANAGSGIRGWLATIAGLLGGSLKVVLQAGSSTIGAVTQSGTWAVNSTLQGGSAIVGKVGIDQTTAGTTNGVVVNSSALPTGAATAANQASEVAALGAPADAAYTGSGSSSIIGVLKGLFASTVQRSQYFVGTTLSTLAGGANYTNPSRDGGASPSVWTKYVGYVLSTQAGTVSVYGYPATVGTAGLVLQTYTLTANVPLNISIPNIWRGYQLVVFNGATAATLTVQDGFAAN